MTKFIISKDERARLAVFADYVKKISSFCPLKEKQLFVIDDANKMTVVAMGASASGGNGCVDSVFDVKPTGTDQATTPGSFSLDCSTVVVALSKIRSDDAQIVVDSAKNKVLFENTTTSKNTVTLSTLAQLSQQDIDEQITFINDKLALPEFNSSIELKTTEDAKGILDTFSNLTKILDASDTVCINKKSVKTADNFCIASYSVADGTLTDEDDDILLPRDIAVILKNTDKIKIDANKKHIFINIGNCGIRFLMQPKLPKWQYPTDDEIEEIVPLDTKKISLKTTPSAVFDALDKFDGMFDAGQWRHDQIKIETQPDVAATNEILFHFDDMNAEVREFLTVSDVNVVDHKKAFEFIVPCKHLKQLKSIISKASELTLEYNEIDPTSPNGMAMKVGAGDLSLVIAKLLD